MADATLVIGADGFVGRRLVPFLQERGQVVVAWRRGDGPPGAALAKAAISHVVNVAGRTFVPASWQDPVPFYEDNLLTTAAALQVCRMTGAPLVHLSSYVYGVPRTLPIPEDHPLEAVNPYAHSKILAESVIDFHRQHMGVVATVIRPFNLYGPGQAASFLIPTIVSQFLDRGRPAIQVADVRPRRDYLHVDDLLVLIAAALKSPGGTFNAGSGVSLSVEALIDRIAAVVGTTKDVEEIGPRRPNEVLDVVADISAARNAFGWQPAIDLSEGLRTVVIAPESARAS
jgi:nucleoside-diphosphate-sugar epimerase